MKKVELLSPAGNMECLYAAVNNGADAVYLGGKCFGARSYANNFTEDELIEAIKFCHLYDVKIYVTANTLIKENEIPDFIGYIRFLHKNGVDAVIMQDLGMINLVHQTFPNLEIHASTQCHTTNDASLKFLKEIGCKRAVLAREMSVNEIKELRADIEKEVFIHGALCISYSGQCLFSSMVLGRSGNRGECAGMCRLPYEAYDENNNKINNIGKYLFSPKELCTISNIKELLTMNIHSLKIEGRMKSPLYVGLITKIYRKYIDAFYKSENVAVTEEEIKILKVLYNREFTTGFLFNDNNLMNSKTPNHIGYKIGVVKNVGKKIKILLIEDIEQGDAIRFINNNLGMYLNFIYNEEGKLINKGKKGQIIYIDNKIGLTKIDDVYITTDISLDTLLNKQKKIPINFKVIAKLHQKLAINIDDGKNNINVEGNIIEESINNPTKKEVIIEKLSKINNTPFKIKQIDIENDNNIFIPMTELNNLRRKIIQALIEKRSNTKQNIIENQYLKHENNQKKQITEISIISKESDYKSKPNKIFYTENNNLYQKYKQNNDIYLILPRISNNKMQYTNENLVINNIGDLYQYYKNNNIHTGIYMNVYNTYTIDLLKKYNVSIIALSPELQELDITNIETKNNISVYIYGKIELMLIKKNIFNNITIIKDRNNTKYKFYNKYNYYVLETQNPIDFKNQKTNFIRMKEE